MSKSYKVSGGVYRYVIPFMFDGSFEEAYTKVEAQRKEKKEKKKEEYKNIWIRRKVGDDKQESDLYAYVRNELRCGKGFTEVEATDLDVLQGEKVGCEWRHWRGEEGKVGDGKKILDLLYFDNPIKNEDTLPPHIDLPVTDAGLMLFRNGLGFLWYELELPKETEPKEKKTKENKNITEIDSNWLKRFQNRVRELNRNDELYFWEKCQDTTENRVLFDEQDGHPKYMTPFLFSHWAAETLSFLPVHFFASRKPAYGEALKKAEKRCGALKNKKSFNNRAVGEEGSCNMVPDKALLFTYCCMEVQEELQEDETYRLAYYLANGYKDSYLFSTEKIQEIRKPFENVRWYATQEGMAYLVWPTGENKSFFRDNFLPEIRKGYFRLYMKVLYQSYSLLIYAQRIQMEISAKAEEELDEQVEKIFREINLFLCKSMATSVSHIDHQSVFYNYLKERLRVHADVKSVRAGMDGLNSLWQRQEEKKAVQAEKERTEREKQAEKKQEQKSNQFQYIMGLFTIFGIFSAFVDSFTFVALLIGKETWNGLSTAEVIGTVSIWVFLFLVCVKAICFTVNAYKGAFRKESKNRGEE